MGKICPAEAHPIEGCVGEGGVKTRGREANGEATESSKIGFSKGSCFSSQVC